MTPSELRMVIAACLIDSRELRLSPINYRAAASDQRARHMREALKFADELISVASPESDTPDDNSKQNPITSGDGEKS